MLVFDDLNGNWLRDSGEKLLAGARITIQDAAFTQVGQFVTDGISEPRCFVLPAGIYYIREVDPPGYISRAPDWWSIALVSQSDMMIAFADESASSTLTATPTPSRTPTRLSQHTPTATVSKTPTATHRSFVYLPLILAPSPAHGFQK